MIQPTSSASEILSWAEKDGVDLSLLRERLKLTPTERLQRHEASLTLAEALRNAGRRKRAQSQFNSQRTK